MEFAITDKEYKIGFWVLLVALAAILVFSPKIFDEAITIRGENADKYNEAVLKYNELVEDYDQLAEVTLNLTGEYKKLRSGYTDLPPKKWTL